MKDRLLLNQNTTMTYDATSQPSWQHFINVYRIFFGTNAGLDSTGIRALNEHGLQIEIKKMTAILRKEKLT